MILAGGEGTRLRSMTREIAGDDRPKQFCPIVGGRTLLEQTRQRVALSIDSNQTLLVVTKRHERFNGSAVDTLPHNLVLEQPENRGTGAAILYALFRIAGRSPLATVAFFPSDHHFSDDEAFMSHVDLAFDEVRARPESVVLLGITPQGRKLNMGGLNHKHRSSAACRARSLV